MMERANSRKGQITKDFFLCFVLRRLLLPSSSSSLFKHESIVIYDHEYKTEHFEAIFANFIRIQCFISSDFRVVVVCTPECPE